MPSQTKQLKLGEATNLLKESEEQEYYRDEEDGSSSDYESGSSEYETDSEDEEDEVQQQQVKRVIAQETREGGEPEQWAGDEDDLEQPGTAHSPAPQASKQKQSSQANGRTPPAPQESQRRINPDFKDVRETGKWGSLSRKEIYLVAVVGILVVVGIVLVVVFLVTRNDDDSAPLTRPPAPTASPTMSPTRAPLTDVATSLRDAIGALPSLESSLAALPEDMAFYEGLSDDETKPANVRAMSWVLYDDPMEPGPTHPELPIRYALATLYHATGGPAWVDSSGWFTNASSCEWHGMFCDGQGRIDEVDLNRNNLVNGLPNEIALLQDVQAFSVRRNSLTGQLPGRAFNDMPKLSLLYVDNNQFTGTIPGILAKGNLNVFFCNANNWTQGSFFPLAFCDGNNLNLTQAGVSCEVTTCICCEPTKDCL